MSRPKITVSFLCLLSIVDGCSFQQSNSYLADLNLHSGRFNTKGGYSGAIAATLESHDNTLLFLADIKLKSGKLSIDIIKPDGEVFKSLIATKNGRIKVKEELPSILGEWKMVAKSDSANGFVNLSFKIPMEKRVK